MHPTHKVAYESKNGPVAKGMQLDHLCHNRLCIKVEHLREVTRKQNQEHRINANANSSTGVRNVYQRENGSFRVIVGHHRKLYHGGTFATIEDADTAAKALRISLFTHSDADRKTI